MMQGKVVMVTGATNGIGQAAALEIAKMNATLVIVGRNPEKTEKVVAELKKQSGNAQIDMLIADLASMAEIRALAQAFKAKYDRLDVLLNNAGAYFSERRDSVDGFEMTFATNHLNYFLLTNLLLDVLKASAPARIVNVSSDAHESITEINWDNLDGKQSYERMGFQTYGLSKLANVLFTRELARRLGDTPVTVNALHPGVIATGLGTNNTGPLLGVLYRILALFLSPPEKGAETLVYLTTSPEVEDISGGYFIDCKAVDPSPLAQDDEAAQKLWEISAQMVGLNEMV